MKQKKETVWTEHLFRKFIRLTDKNWLIEKLKSANSDKDPENKGKIQVNRSYTLYKNMFGVMIEAGKFEIRKILLQDALSLLNRFVKILVKRKEVRFQAQQNFSGIIQTVEIFDLETPDESAVQGYALNKELVFFEEEPYSCIILKYKDSPENIFLLYRFYFTFLSGELFLIIEKDL